MTGEGRRKIVAASLGFGDKKQVIRFGRMERGFQSVGAGIRDGARRQSGVLISVVRVAAGEIGFVDHAAEAVFE